MKLKKNKTKQFVPSIASKLVGQILKKPVHTHSYVSTRVQDLSAVQCF